MSRRSFKSARLKLRAEGVPQWRMEEIQFQQVESSEQKEQAGALIREYLAWLNERVKHDYGIEFDVNAMIESDLSDLAKFHPPDGRFYLARHANAVAGVGCLKKLADGVGEIQRMYVLPAFRGGGHRPRYR